MLGITARVRRSSANEDEGPVDGERRRKSQSLYAKKIYETIVWREDFIAPSLSANDLHQKNPEP